MRILIAVPCGDLLDVNFVDSLLHLEQPENISLDIQLASGSLIYDARNGLARRAVEGKFDYILWLDSDMSFEPDLLKRMIESIGDKEFLSAMFFSRRPPFKATIYSKCGYTEKEDGSNDLLFESYHPIPEGIFEIAASGFAAVLCKVELFKEIFDAGGLPFSPMLGFGEDLSACIRFRSLGHKLYCDSTIYVGHTAHIIIGGESYKEAWNGGMQ